MRLATTSTSRQSTASKENKAHQPASLATTTTTQTLLSQRLNTTTQQYMLHIFVFCHIVMVACKPILVPLMDTGSLDCFILLIIYAVHSKFSKVLDSYPRKNMQSVDQQSQYFLDFITLYRHYSETFTLVLAIDFVLQATRTATDERFKPQLLIYCNFYSVRFFPPLDKFAVCQPFSLQGGRLFLSKHISKIRENREETVLDSNDPITYSRDDVVNQIS